MKLDQNTFAGMLDLVDLRNTATKNEIMELIDDACRYNVHSIAAPYCFHPLIVDQLKKRGRYNDIVVIGGAGFPDGNWPTEVKLASIARCLEVGCGEIDLTGNVNYVKSAMWDEYDKEIAVVRNLTRGFILKVILQTPLLNNEEIIKCCDILMRNGVDFVKTDTGRNSSPTLIEHVSVIKNAVGDRMEIKASGGIRDLETITKMIEIGVSRFGMSRKSAIKILDELDN